LEKLLELRLCGDRKDISSRFLIEEVFKLLEGSTTSEEQKIPKNLILVI